MAAKPTDAEVVTRFVEATSDLSTREAGELVGVSHTTVAGWRSGPVNRLNRATRRAILKFLAEGEGGRSGGSGIIAHRVREPRVQYRDDYPEVEELKWPEPELDDPDDVKQYLTFFGAEADAFRRMAKRLPLSDLAKGCLEDAREENMPDEHFAILYDRLAHLL